MGNYPVCPYCNANLEYKDMIDDQFDSSTYEVSWRGTCPACERTFTWREVYHYSYADSIEEETDNG